MKNGLPRDKAIEKLVASKLRARVAARGADQGKEACLDAEILAAYVEHALAPSEGLSCETHLAACAPCREQLAQLVRLSQADEPAERPAERAAPAQSAWFRWAWAAPLLAALVATGVWYSRVFRRPSQQPQQAALQPAAAKRQQVAPLPTEPELAKARPSKKPLPKLADTSEVTKVYRAASKAQSAGLTGAGNVTDQVAAGDREAAAGAAAGVIATPSERARLAAAGGAPEANFESKAASPAPPTAPLPAALPAAPASANEDVAATSQAVKAKEPAAGLSLLPAKGVAAGKPLALRAAQRWRVGPRGLIQKADLQGNWVTEASGVKADLYDVTFPTPSVGWAAGQAGTLLRTTDGGTSWNPISVPTAEDLLRVTATDDRVASVVTRGGETLATTDGGQSWKSSYHK